MAPLGSLLWPWGWQGDPPFSVSPILNLCNQLSFVECQFHRAGCLLYNCFFSVSSVLMTLHMRWSLTAQNRPHPRERCAVEQFSQLTLIHSVPSLLRCLELAVSLLRHSSEESILIHLWDYCLLYREDLIWFVVQKYSNIQGSNLVSKTRWSAMVIGFPGVKNELGKESNRTTFLTWLRKLARKALPQGKVKSILRNDSHLNNAQSLKVTTLKGDVHLHACG